MIRCKFLIIGTGMCHDPVPKAPLNTWSKSKVPAAVAPGTDARISTEYNCRWYFWSGPMACFLVVRGTRSRAWSRRVVGAVGVARASRSAHGAYEGDAAVERRASPPGDAVSHTNTLKRYLEKASRSFQMLPTDSDHVRLAASPASQQYFSLTPL